jgi:glycerol-3-phosphate dehydrogenase
VLLYDTLGGARAVPRHRHLTRRGALRLAPALRPETLTGGIQYYDAQVDDARHAMTVARTATHYGAAVANSARVIGFLREGERVTGVRVRDLETGSELDVHAREVINATGVWTDDTQELAGGRGRFQVRASKGIHLVVPRDRIHADTGIITRTAKSVLFVIPWGRHWLDLVAKEPQLRQPIPGAEDYLLAEARYAASHEGALHLDDILTRRTRISIETWDRGLAAAAPVARLVAPVLGWDDAAADREIEHYRARVAAERESQEQQDDHTADAARLGAPDVRAGALG